MRRTSVYLDEEQARRLARLARQEGRPQAAILRDAVARYEPLRSRGRNFAIAAGFTRVDSDKPPISEIPDERAFRGLRQLTLLLTIRG